MQANPSLAIDFIIAPPRMAYYMEYSTRIYQVYLKYIAPEDIVVYSIDEVFMDIAKLTILKEAARTLNYLTENNLLQYADLEKKVEDVHSSYDRTGKELKGVEARLREVQPLIKNISNYQRLKPVYDAFQKAKDKPSFKAKHEAELVIFEAARSTLLAMQGDEKLHSLKTLQAEQQRLLEEQQRLYDERAKLKKEARMIDTLKANVDDFLKPSAEREQEQARKNQLE